MPAALGTALPGHRLLGVLLLGVSLAACGGGDITPPPPPPPPPSVASVRVAATTTALMAGMATAATATALDASGSVISGRTITWSSESDAVATVNAQGAVQAVGAGSTGIVATVDGKQGRVALNVVAKPDCANTALTLGIGESRVLDAASRASLCVTSGTYSVVALSTSLVPSSRTQLEATGAGLFSTGTSAATIRMPETFNGAALRLPGTSEVERIDVAAHVAKLASIPGAASLLFEVRNPRRLVASNAVKVGDLTALYAEGGVSPTEACTKRPLITGRVSAIGRRVIIVADTANPAGGYTDLDYQQFASDFDASVFPVDSAAFATPVLSSQVVVFFTREVNRETSAGAQSGSMLGYFVPRDLASTQTCPTSNGLEMFYMRVPDPIGTVNTNKVSKDAAKGSVLGTLVHELQHLINFEQRAIKGLPAEEAWMNEGLSTIAQELLFYKLSGMSPKQNLNTQAVQRSTTAVEAFNATLFSQFGNLAGYLAAPETNTFFQSGVPSFPAESYGAAWQFLRFAADRSARDQATLWRSIQVAPTTGLATVRSILGDPSTLMRDFAIAQSLSAAGVSSTTAPQFLSWNFRDIYMTGLGLRQYPLQLRTVSNGSMNTLSLAGGGTAYLLLDVAAGGIGAVRVMSQSQPLPASLDLLLVRTR